MEKHNYTELSQERFDEIQKLHEQQLHHVITAEDFDSKVTKDELADYRIMAQIKMQK